MSQTNWFNPLTKITPFIFKIKTPSGSGTGFQIMFTERDEFCGIATADHVISHEDEWEEPIRIIHHASGKSVLLKEKDRVIFRYPDKDLAFILFNKADLPIEPKPLQLIDKGKILKQGVEVGWCGFPAVAINQLCFFAGYISCPISKEDSYLVDGVAINGVSGGPVFYLDSTNEPKFSGVISAYRANRATGESLPGLCVVRSVEPYQETLQNLKNLEEAKQKEEEEKKKQEEAKQKEEEEKKKQPKKSQQKKQSTNKVNKNKK
jgi:hypothetical protein